MSHLSDWFGGADRTVLQHPYFHAQRRQPNATLDGPSVAGENVRVPNTIIRNEIQGAGLGGEGIILPAGKFRVKARAAWKTDDTTTQARCQLQIVSPDRSVLLQGVNDTARDTHGGQVNEVEGIIELNASQEVIIAQWITLAVATDGLGEDMDATGGFDKDEVYAEIIVTQLDERKVEFTVNDPSFTLARVFMHVQHTLPSGQSTGLATVTGANRIPLNAEVLNEIPGAIFNAAQGTITLPAGTYYFKAQSSARTGNTAATDLRRQLSIRRADNGALLLAGVNNTINSGTGTLSAHTPVMVEGKVTLSQSTDVELSLFVGNGATSDGFGAALDSGDQEVFGEIFIYQQDAVAAVPVLVNDKLYPLPGGVIVTGNMHGLEYSRKNDNEVTVQPGICMDSTNEFVLTLATAQDVSIAIAPSTYTNLFLCDDGFVRTDTDDDGAGLVGFKIRWIGFVYVHAAGTLALFRMNGKYMNLGHMDEADMIDMGNLTSTFAAYDHSQYMPISRIELIKYGVHGQSATATDIVTSIDGTNVEFVLPRADADIQIKTGIGAWGDSARMGLHTIPFDNNRLFKRLSANTRLTMHMFKMKR